MYTKKQIIRKLLIGAALLLVAVCVTVFIQENMAVQSPEHSLPTITITMDQNSTFSESSIFRAGYEWNFLTTTAKHTPPYSTEDILQAAAPVLLEPRTYLDISFSIEPKKVRISRADGKSPNAFMELVDAGTGPLVMPATPGFYLYQLQVDFGWRGSIVYFFTVQVRDTTAA